MSPERFAAVVEMSVTAARSLEVALYSLEADHVRAAGQLATFLLGVLRTLERVDPDAAIAWRDRVDIELGRDVLALCRTTGQPAFMDSKFLDFLTGAEKGMT